MSKKCTLDYLNKETYSIELLNKKICTSGFILLQTLVHSYLFYYKHWSIETYFTTNIGLFILILLQTLVHGDLFYYKHWSIHTYFTTNIGLWRLILLQTLVHPYLFYYKHCSMETYFTRTYIFYTNITKLCDFTCCPSPCVVVTTLY